MSAMSEDEAIERVVEAVDDMCCLAGKNGGGGVGVRHRDGLRIALKELLAAHDAELAKHHRKDCYCPLCDKTT